MDSSDTVYVDQLQPTNPTYTWRYKSGCHLLCCNEERLHEFAAEIGLKRSWFHQGSLPHYDLTPGMRHKALEHGAKDMNHLSNEDVRQLMLEFHDHLKESMMRTVPWGRGEEIHLDLLP